MMNRTEINENIMVQVNGGTNKDKETKYIMDKKKVMDVNDMPYALTTPDGKRYYSDGNRHSVSIEVK